MGKRIHDFMFGEELPGESMPWQTVTELIDNRRVLIENHRGIIAYNSEKILIKLPSGQLCVCGSDLCVACMSRQQVIIKGTILSITVTKGI